MRPFSTLGRTYPYATALSVVALFAGYFLLPLLLRGTVDMTGGTGQIAMTDLRPFIIGEGLLLMALLVVIAALRWWRQSGLAVRADPAGLRLFGWIVIVPLLIVGGLWSYIATQSDGTPRIPGFGTIALLAILIGVFEETLFRGVLFHGLRQRLGPGAAVVMSALLFGGFHLVNAVFGQSLFLTVIQIATATALGLFLAAIVLQTRTIWPAVALHALWDAYALSVPLAVAIMPIDPQGPQPSPGVASLFIPALLSLASFVIYRRWRRRNFATVRGQDVDNSLWTQGNKGHRRRT